MSLKGWMKPFGLNTPLPLPFFSPPSSSFAPPSPSTVMNGSKLDIAPCLFYFIYPYQYLLFSSCIFFSYGFAIIYSLIIYSLQCNKSRTSCIFIYVTHVVIYIYLYYILYIIQYIHDILHIHIYTYIWSFAHLRAYLNKYWKWTC